MKKIIFLLLVFCESLYSLDVFSQNNIDSLVQVLKSAKEDIAKANTLNLLSKENYQAGDYERSRKYSDEAMKLSEKLGYDKGKAMAHLYQGITYFYEGDYPKAQQKYSDALSISEKIKDKKLIGTCYNYVGLLYTYQRNYAIAEKIERKGLRYQEEIVDSAGMGKSYHYLGIIYEEQGNYTEALKSYLSLLKIAEARGDKKGIADANFNIGNVYGFRESFKDALNYHKQALKFYEEIGYKQSVATCYISLGDTYRVLDSLELALNYSRKAFELFEAIGDRVHTALAKVSIAHIHTKLGNYSEVLQDYSSALKLFTEVGDTLNMSITYKGIGEMYFDTGKWDEALKNFNTSLQMSKAIGYTANIVYLYGAISSVYEKKNDYKNAYLNHKIYFALNDSVLSETKSTQIAEMQTRYESEKKDNEILVLNKDKEIKDVKIKKQKLMMYSFIGGFALIMVLLLIGYRNYRTRHTLRLQNIRNKIAGDLHDDIGSTLNSISIYSEVARKKDKQQDEALEMIGDASRKIIDAMSDIVWTVTPENDSFSKIIFRMKSFAYNLLRAKKIEFTFHADETLNDKKLSLEVRRNFYLIFKESVNNLVKYSVATTVAINLSYENELIKLRIHDNGIGFDTSQENIGNGLKNMKRRADEMKAQFKIESGKGNGTQIELILKA